MKKLTIEPLDFELNPALLTEGFTQSEMQTWDNCPELWYLRYNLMLEKKNQPPNWATIYGSWMHASLEEWYLTRGKRWTWNPEFKADPVVNHAANAEREFWTMLGERQLQVYTSHYKHDFDLMKVLDTEVVVDIKFEGFRLKGMIDLPVFWKPKKMNVIIDHKTSSRLDRSVMEGWDFRFQFMFYLWLAHKHPEWEGKTFGGTMPNGIKKPQLKQGVREPTLAFVQRIHTDMRERPDAYFYRDLMILKKDDLEYFEKHILMPKLFRLRMLLNPKVDKSIKIGMIRNKNTDQCMKYGAKYACQFRDLCRPGGNPASMPLYKERSAKHTELESEE